LHLVGYILERFIPIVEQFPDKINCVTLHLVGYILERFMPIVAY